MRSTSKDSLTMTSVVRYTYLISGFLLVGIGVLGIFLPILPTTIFLILASACFMKSSPKADAWLRKNKYLGAYLRNYRDKTGLTLKSKLVHIFILWISILLSAFLFTDLLSIRILLIIIAAGVTIHLISIRTAEE